MRVTHKKLLEPQKSQEFKKYASFSDFEDANLSKDSKPRGMFFSSNILSFSALLSHLLHGLRAQRHNQVFTQFHHGILGLCFSSLLPPYLLQGLRGAGDLLGRVLCADCDAGAERRTGTADLHQGATPVPSTYPHHQVYICCAFSKIYEIGGSKNVHQTKRGLVHSKYRHWRG